MEIDVLLSLLRESLFVIIVFTAMIAYALVRGKQAIINLILGFYFALLLTMQFPYTDAIRNVIAQPQGDAYATLLLFLLFTILATVLFTRLMPREFDEKPHQGLGHKLLFALGATMLVMAYSYHVLPVTTFVDPGSPIQKLFGPEEGFFVWLVLPLILLFVL